MNNVYQEIIEELNLCNSLLATFDNRKSEALFGVLTQRKEFLVERLQELAELQ